MKVYVLICKEYYDYTPEVEVCNVLTEKTKEEQLHEWANEWRRIEPKDEKLVDNECAKKYMKFFNYEFEEFEI